MSDIRDCRTYLEYLKAEHRRLHAYLLQARGSILLAGGLDHDAHAADVVRSLQQIRSELERHFREEEEGGCLDEAACHCPRLSAIVGRIESEHTSLLAELDALIERSTCCESTAAERAAFTESFERFYDRVQQHEASENDVLQQAFGMTVNGDDMPQPTTCDF